MRPGQVEERAKHPNPLGNGSSGAPLRTCGDGSPQIPPRPARSADPQNDATRANSSHVKGDAGHGSATETLCRYCEAGLIVEGQCRNCGAWHGLVRGLPAEEYQRGADSLETEVRSCAAAADYERRRRTMLRLGAVCVGLGLCAWGLFFALAPWAVAPVGTVAGLLLVAGCWRRGGR